MHHIDIGENHCLTDLHSYIQTYRLQTDLGTDPLIDAAALFKSYVICK